MAAENVLEGPPEETAEVSEETLQASSGFIGQWHTLVSTTNWDKGQIICQWRTALEAAAAPVTEYSDEAWAQMVGEVTGQHVGRLRRTFERFGEAASEYKGLYWSHFQVALDWTDAEMWLEGAIQNGWSVAKMRAKRWETVEQDNPEAGTAAGEAPAESSPNAELSVDAVDAEVRSAAPAGLDGSASGGGDSEDGGSRGDSEADEVDSGAAPSAERRQVEAEAVQPMKDLAELPEDLADAFEQFKLAILNHKMSGWAEISRQDVLASLAALEQLALAPSGD